MTGLRKLTSGLPVFPLAVMFGLFFFDEWDTAAFNVLAPNIQHAFHLSDRGFGFLVISNLSIVLLAAVPLGYYGDRLPRVRLVTAGAVIAGVFSLLTGLAGTLLFLVLIRLGNGFGRLVNDPIHSSLLSDYYLPGDRPGVYAFHRNAERLAQVVGPAFAGAVAAVWGWRAAFMVLLVPILVVAVVSVRLREPVRGQTDDPE
jgi:MFS family permease